MRELGLGKAEKGLRMLLEREKMVDESDLRAGWDLFFVFVSL